MVRTTYHSLERLFDLVLDTAFIGLCGLLLGCHGDMMAQRIKLRVESRIW